MILVNRFLFVACASTLLMGVPVSVCRAARQDATAAAPAPPAAQDRPTTTSRAYRAMTATATAASPAWLDSKIDLDFKDASVAEAVKKVMEAAKAGSNAVDSDFTLPGDIKVSLKAKDVTARDALAAVARLGGALAYITDKDGKATVWLRKRTTTATAPVIWTTNTANGPSMSIEVQRQVESALAEAQRATRAYSGAALTYGVGKARLLPDKRVSLDVKGTDVRDVLKTLMKQTGLDYVLEGDIPEEVKKSFTFENVPLNMALDVVCESAGIGWSAERTASVSGADKKDAKIVVRIGKKYASSLRRLNSSTLFDAPFTEMTMFDVPASSFTPFAPLTIPLPTPSLDL